MIDLHSHILPGFDDGSESLDESIRMAEAAVADGVRIVVATPHVRDDYPTRAADMIEAVAGLNSELLQRGVQLVVLSGGEIALDMLPEISTEQRRLFGLGGNSQALLLEFPYYGWPLGLEGAVSRLADGGTRAVIAHPERNGEVQEAPERLSALIGMGGILQITAGSVTGANGRAAKRVVDYVVREAWPCAVASDWHHSSGRPGLRDATGALKNDAFAAWMSRDVPKAVVAGRTIPDAPARRRRGFLRGRGSA